MKANRKSGTPMQSELAITAASEEHDGGVEGDLVSVVRRFESPLLRYAQQILRQRPDQAQDVVQEVFLKLHKALVRKRPPITNVSSWLYRVTHNQAVDLLRREKRYAAVDDEVLAQQEAPEDASSVAQLPRAEARAMAVAEVQHLPLELRQVLLLKIIEGMTLQQVSEVTGESISTVHYRLGKGLRLLAQRLKAKGAV
jgi:RNA polymerase sigma-70 factor (ECF subfamily)